MKSEIRSLGVLRIIALSSAVHSPGFAAPLRRLFHFWLAPPPRPCIFPDPSLDLQPRIQLENLSEIARPSRREDSLYIASPEGRSLPCPSRLPHHRMWMRCWSRRVALPQSMTRSKPIPYKYTTRQQIKALPSSRRRWKRWQIASAFTNSRHHQAGDALVFDVCQWIFVLSAPVDSGLVTLPEKFRPPGKVNLRRQARTHWLAISEVDRYTSPFGVERPLLQERIRPQQMIVLVMICSSRSVFHGHASGSQLLPG